MGSIGVAHDNSFVIIIVNYSAYHAVLLRREATA